jgi:purine-cytosine permease-like protein
MCWFVFAATMAINFGAINALIGLLLTVICYSLINGIIAKFAIDTGLSVGLFSTLVFGKYGSALATFLFFACATYYSLFEGSVIAIAFHHYFPALSQSVWNFIVVAYSVLLVFGSVQKWLDKFNGFLFPFYLAGLIFAVGLTFYNVGFNGSWLNVGPENPPRFGWVSCFAYLMGVWILMMFTFDYSRFGKVEDREYHARWNFGWTFNFFTFFVNGLAAIFILGSLATPTSSVNELTVVFDLLGLMGIFGLIFVWISQTRINTANFYLASVNLESFIKTVFGLSVSRIHCAIVVGLAVFVLMASDVFSYVLEALAYQGVFIVAWVAVAVTHILMTRTTSGVYSLEQLTQERTHSRGLGIWVIASLVGVFAIKLGGVASEMSGPLTAIAAVLLYWMSSKLPRRSLAV